MPTYDELRTILKRMDAALAIIAYERETQMGRHALYEGFDELTEYLLKSHARMERLASEVSLLKERLR